MNFLNKIFQLEKEDLPGMGDLAGKIESILKNNQESLNLHSSFLQELQTLEDKITVIASLAGLLARVSYTDLKVDSSEVDKMAYVLQYKTNLSSDLCHEIVNVSVNEIELLSGIDQHRYAKPLNHLLSPTKRYQILESLFIIAASDGGVSNLESEEIRLITKSLNLEQKHFISARASVKDYLDALKKD